MMKSYIFNQISFLENKSGGIFSYDERKLEFKSPSKKLISKIKFLSTMKISFTQADLPVSVINMLLQNQLIREFGEKIAMQESEKPRSSRGFCPHEFKIISAEFSEKFVRPWAFLTAPMGILVIFLVDLIWLVSGEYSHLTNKMSFSLLPITGKIGFFFYLALFFLFHELSHCAAVFHRRACCGGVFLRYKWYLPVLFTKIDRIDDFLKIDKIIVSASGCLFQIFISILAIHALDFDTSMGVAARYSILVALVNLLPLYKLDGYWIVSDAIGKRFKFTLMYSKLESENFLYTIALIAMLFLLGIIGFILSQ